MVFLQIMQNKGKKNQIAAPAKAWVAIVLDFEISIFQLFYLEDHDGYIIVLGGFFTELQDLFIDIFCYLFCC